MYNLLGNRCARAERLCSEFPEPHLEPIGHHIPDRTLDRIRLDREKERDRKMFFAGVRGGTFSLDWYLNECPLCTPARPRRPSIFDGEAAHGILGHQQNVKILEIEHRVVGAEWHDATCPVHAPGEGSFNRRGNVRRTCFQRILALRAHLSRVLSAETNTSICSSKRSSPTCL